MVAKVAPERPRSSTGPQRDCVLPAPAGGVACYAPIALPFGLLLLALVLAHGVWSAGPLLGVGALAASLLTAAALANGERRRMRSLRDHARQLAALVHMGDTPYLCETPTALVQVLVDVACAVLPVRSVTGYLRDAEDTTRLKRMTLASRGAPYAGPAYLPAPIPGTGIRPLQLAGLGTALWTPILVDDVEVAGLLLSCADVARLEREEREILRLLARQAAAMLYNVRLYARVQAQASTDGLTGLLTHRAFQARLDEEVLRARRGSRPLSLMMIDLDDFRTINNTYGHPIGDATLVGLATAIRATIRAGDVAARYGGDEFAVILPETDFDEALVVAERMGAAIADLRIGEQDVSVRLGGSIGVASLPQHASTRQDLVRAADQAQYAAKHAGKGRVGSPEEVSLPFHGDPALLASQLEHADLGAIEALAAAVDTRDPFNRGHSQRVSSYATALAGALNLPIDEVLRVQLAALLHDVGKIGIPDSILSKPGKLTGEEYHLVQQHPVIGEHMLAAVPFLREMLPAIRHHHERWDGEGYPDGLAGAAIPRDASILAVADALETMTSDRPYRAALPLSEALRRIIEGAGTQFDPSVVAALAQAVDDGSLALLLPDLPVSLYPEPSAWAS